MKVFITRDTQDAEGAVSVWTEKPNLLTESPDWDSEVPAGSWETNEWMDGIWLVVNPDRDGFDDADSECMTEILQPLLDLALSVPYGEMIEAQVSPVQVAKQ